MQVLSSEPWRSNPLSSTVVSKKLRACASCCAARRSSGAGSANISYVSGRERVPKDLTDPTTATLEVEPLSARYGLGMRTRALTGSLRGKTITIVAPEDFVLLKILSTRDRDAEDAASVLRALGTRVDLELVRREASLLAVEIPDHPIAERLERVVRGV